MTTEQKCVEIIKAIQKIVDADRKAESYVAFRQDWGGNSLTVEIDGSHTHVGLDDGSFDNLVSDLLNSLTDGPGLSFSPQLPRKP